MRTSTKALLAAAGAGILLAGCATGPYDYGYPYDDYGYPAYGYYGYEPGYYVGPSVDFGAAYYDGGRGRWHRDWRDGDRHWRDRDHGGPPPSVSPEIPCCGPGSGPGGSPTQRDAERWGAGG